MKLKDMYELQRCMAVMNADGLELLVNAAKDIAGRDKFRRARGEPSPLSFDRHVKQALELLDKNRKAV